MIGSYALTGFRLRIFSWEHSAAAHLPAEPDDIPTPGRVEEHGQCQTSLGPCRKILLELLDSSTDQV